MKNLLAKLGLAGTSSIVVTESVQLDALYSALITLAISVVSVLAVEGVQWLKNFIISKTKKNKDKEKETEQSEE